VSGYTFLYTLKIRDITADAMDAKFHEHFDGLRKCPDDVTDDHVTADFEFAFSASGFGSQFSCGFFSIINFSH
jgi:hypothetical protein